MLDAGFRSIPREQSEAAWACGHNGPQIFMHVLLPQVGVIVMPPMASQFIEIVKNSAAAMLLGIKELTFQTQNIDVDVPRLRGGDGRDADLPRAGSDHLRGHDLPGEPHQMAVRGSAFGPVEPTALDRWLWRGAVAATLLLLVFLLRDQRWEVVIASGPFLLRSLGVSWLLTFAAMASACRQASCWRFCVPADRRC